MTKSLLLVFDDDNDNGLLMIWWCNNNDHIVSYGPKNLNLMPLIYVRSCICFMPIKVMGKCNQNEAFLWHKGQKFKSILCFQIGYASKAHVLWVLEQKEITKNVQYILCQSW